jgi:maltooligosyltrehalose synthase
LILAPKWFAGSGMEQNPSAQAKLWGNTSIVLPDNMAANWRHVLTGELVTAQADQRAALRVSDALKNFPVGLLLSNPPR